MLVPARDRSVQVTKIKTFFAILCTIALVACGAETTGIQASTQEGQTSFVELSHLDGVTPLRTVTLTLEPGRTKRYRIKAEHFEAHLTQTGAVPARLSAKHYAIDIYGETSTTAWVRAESDDVQLRNWTLRVQNLGSETLHATVSAYHLDDLVVIEEEAPSTRETEVIFSPMPYYQSHLHRIMERMAEAEHSIDVAMYSMSDTSIRNALGEAVERGLSVRVIFDPASSERKNPEGTRSAHLESMGIDVRYVNKIMHHKFALIDGVQDEGGDAASTTVITGSGNWSYGGASKYDENTVMVRGDAELATTFQSEFNHMWANSRDFEYNLDLSYFETLYVERPDLEQVDGLDVAFTSDNFTTYVSSRYGATFRARTGYNTVADRIVSLINEAQESIWIASGHMRSRPIADALKAKRISHPELDIRVYLDGQEYVSGWKQGDQVRKLQECLEAAGGRANKEQKCYDVGYYFGYELGDSGMDVRYKFYAFRWNYGYAVQMHHKYIIVDGSKVASGSYNYSDNAEHNTLENVVFYSANRYPQVVNAFVENFQSIWNTGDGLLEELINVVQTDDTFPIVFDSMALSWTDVTRLKNVIRENCPEIYSDEFRNNATEHLTCTRP
ncbi:MAG: hypothetical protein HOI23_17030 [Deltaproteobacteria bacterium]|nr:hypothetical protein [Deltaproteobacteria bacterium]MBT6433712.1 hypothetical protein [Deltaproteobacteria bacterium]MBT6488940.1 hypothetical protein [Deltaproteobacteria bacterium]